MRLEDLAAYEIMERREMEDIHSEGVYLRHKKTGAKVALLKNDDENKVFCIGFRTPPKDSTGVAHIVEHTVLCGSDKYPVKDPFVELVKGSLNTFLNAMTYPDKTVYPVASCNDTDFKNLMDVYLDAVFHPNIYKEEKIFRQEGWHYEMEDVDAPLTINGVVYNEMKGAFSSPDEVFSREVFNSLYPDTTYGFESGGDPDVIPELSYEEFLDFHSRYYHPSNSYIYLYGDMDMAERLDYLDREYLSLYEEKKVDSEIDTQKAFTKVNRVVKEYPVNETEEEKENTYLSLNISVGDTMDKELYIAFQILDYALCTAPGAVLKRALTDAGIGTDVYSVYDNGSKQPYFSIVAKNAEADMEERFLSIISEVLSDVCKKGLDKKALLAGLNFYEFKYREADFGSTPKGLMYGLQMFDSWLYDDSKPFLHVEANETYTALREKAGGDYFEKLIQEYLIDNTHKSIVILVPKAGLTEQKEKESMEKLEAYKETLSKKELEKIVAFSKELKEYQDAPDKEEDLEKIPLLKRSDMKKEAAHFINDLRMIGDTRFLYHNIYSNGIAYIRLIFDMKNVPEELICYVGVLKDILGLMDTKHYAYSELFNEILIKTGGMSTVSNLYGSKLDLEKCTKTLECKVKVLETGVEDAFALMKEMLLNTKFDDKKRLKEILLENKSKMRGNMMAGAHSVAVTRALSGISKTAATNEMMSGIAYYRFLDSLTANFEEKADELIHCLKELVNIIFRPENLMVDFTGNEKISIKIEEQVRILKEELNKTPVQTGLYEPNLKIKREGFKTPGQVQYVCRAGNFRKKGIPYTGVLRVLKVMMGYDYLWNQVRVKGGAYGCMCGFAQSGDCYFVSYRDPNLKNTIQVYENAADYIAGFEPDERELTQFIIGAISDLDAPMSAAGKGLFSLSGFMTDLTDEDLQKERDEVLGTTAQDLKRTSEQIRAFMGDECLCVVGNAEKISASKELFDKVENLI